MNEFDPFFNTCLIVFLLLPTLLFFIYQLDKRSRIKRIYKVIVWNFLLILYGIFTLFIVGESYYRFFVDTTDSFAINKVSKRWLKRHVKLNNSSSRENFPYHLEIPKGKRRLTIIGDSFSNGHGIKDLSKTYAHIIRRKYGNSIEVHNMSISGANSYSQLDNMKRMLNMGYEYDVILLAYCLNDIDYYVNDTKRIYHRIHNFHSRLGYIAKESYFINTLAFRFFAFKDPDLMNYTNFVLKGYNGHSWDLQKKKLQEIKQFVLDTESNLVVFTFPFLQQSKEDYLFYQAHSNLDAFWKNEEVTHVDLLYTLEPYLGSDLTVNKYDAHPNEFAHELIAGEIERVLQKK